MILFDRKFGKEFLQSVPISPGVYSLFDASGTLIYIGKAKSLRRRLAQYRRPMRTKRGRKMRALIKEAARIEWQVTESELEASLQELRLIQSLAPTRNVVGAFTFLYPLIGLWETETLLHFCFTTVPEKLPQFTYHGAFRSREITGEGFFALMRLLQFVGHSEPRHALGDVPRYSYVFAFRRLPSGWGQLWDEFLRGHSPDALETLVFKLLDHAGARAKASEVQEDVEKVNRLWEKEIAPLRSVITMTSYADYPVTPKERDLIFVRAGFLRQEKEP